MLVCDGGPSEKVVESKTKGLSEGRFRLLRGCKSTDNVYNFLNNNIIPNMCITEYDMYGCVYKKLALKSRSKVKKKTL